MQPPPVTLEQAMDLADHASPAPWIASQALKVMRAEIEQLSTIINTPQSDERAPDFVLRADGASDPRRPQDDEAAGG